MYSLRKYHERQLDRAVRLLLLQYLVVLILWQLSICDYAKLW